MIIVVLSAALAAIVIAAILSAVVAMLLVVVVTLFSDKFKSPTDWYFSAVWKVGKVGAILAVLLWGYFIRMLL